MDIGGRTKGDRWVLLAGFLAVMCTGFVGIDPEPGAMEERSVHALSVLMGCAGARDCGGEAPD